MARAYVEAGSRIILTNTFRANRIALGAHAPAVDVAAVNRAGVKISRRAAARRQALVFASVGPSGKLLIAGQLSEAELCEAFAEQSQALARAGADGIVIETMSDLAEARIAVRAALATGLPVVACMAFDSGKNKDRTMTGVTPRQAAQELTRAGAHVIGANCGVGVEQAIALCAELAAASDRPVWIKPNAGLPEWCDGRVIYRVESAGFAACVPALVAAGARFVGGCCGTSPPFIAAICARLGYPAGSA